MSEKSELDPAQLKILENELDRRALSIGTSRHHRDQLWTASAEVRFIRQELEYEAAPGRLTAFDPIDTVS